MNSAVAVLPPVRLRPTTQTSIGTTAFFRNRARLVTTGFHFERMRSDM